MNLNLTRQLQHLDKNKASKPSLKPPFTTTKRSNCRGPRQTQIRFISEYKNNISNLYKKLSYCGFVKKAGKMTRYCKMRKSIMEHYLMKWSRVAIKFPDDTNYFVYRGAETEVDEIV